ncbi:hypothetical protein FT663_01539 [Candidozyma haemuli var. vulneris]|uniref:chitinase n=1 Tax=Candidozyma haemuli TaxID=45357 RepID=A0A2V1ARH1_9ASCO|nr:hypothetical protein CXQ85_002121 [[Candida] haemuloni]KAF3990694.1 hypothetical protein FT662_02117 [[Candida] haemuloni var. vulneris]KAF3994308.1 hypothetical protein FT663_01539 [[Candida] haemuloni var. vulneris]PVH20334.1 hypothetical protein CXQ85_002121 [[Candida] haemuloni]
MLSQTFLLLLVSLLGKVLAFSASSNKNVAVYWGQNSYGNQDRLSAYCDNDDTDIVLVSFVTGFPELSLNFANQCGGSFSNGVLHCPQIGEDIKTCQSKGKKILLSLGGASGSYGFHGPNADSDAEKFAETLWNKFGAGSDDERPFNDAIVDGFDFDLENNNPTGTVALSNALRKQFSKDSSRQYYLAAAPQCVYPDASSGDILAETQIDFAFIQFYNNYCGLGDNFNWDTWQKFAEEDSPNKDIKLYVGLPGAPSSAGSGYADLDKVKKNVGSDILNNKNFGGFMLWDASSGASNKNSEGVSFTQQLKNYLLGNVEEESPSAPASTSSKPAQTSATSTTKAAAETPAEETPVEEAKPTPSKGVNAGAQPNVPGDGSKTTVAAEATTTQAPQDDLVTVTVQNPSSTFTTVRVSCSSDTLVNTVDGKVVTEVVTVTRVVSTAYLTKTVKAEPTA